MALLIDGYNLLHVTGIFGKGRGVGSLERSRNALLNFLANALDPEELPRTTVVFDAKDAPPGLPRVVKHRGITVRYAAEYEEADDLIEELIRAESAPRQLTVVSSDHRLQRAAARRKATAIDSDRWYDELQQRPAPDAAARATAKPNMPLTGEDVEAWLTAFGDINLEDAEANRPDAGSQTDKDDRGDAAHDADDIRTDVEYDEDSVNPFPPGYGEDLLEEDI